MCIRDSSSVGYAQHSLVVGACWQLWVNARIVGDGKQVLAWYREAQGLDVYKRQITFPDGSVREYEQGVTGLQIAESISPACLLYTSM